MFRGLTIVLLAVGLVAAGAFRLYYGPSSEAERRAAALAGERWYRLTLENRHIGYWHTQSNRDLLGRWHFESVQRFALIPDEPVTLRSRRTFARAAPQHLLEAEYTVERGGFVERTHIDREGQGYRAQIRHARATTPVERHLDWEYTLADYLGFEVWLAQEQPEPGRSRPMADIDFDRLAVVSRVFDVAARTPSGYLIERATPWEPTAIELDADFAAVNMRVAGLFDLTRSTRSEALAARSTLQRATYFVPLDRRLADHTELARIVVSIGGTTPAERVWPQAVQRDGRWLLTLEANPVSTARGSASERLPFDDPRMVALGARIVGATDDESEMARALLDFVHGHLRYERGSPPRPVLELLDEPVGDCTDFADLLTTLALGVGIPGRTVFGLAYADGPVPAFAFHAWNELEIDGRWRAYDPTWNQSRVDATHLPLPEDDTASLKLLTGSLDLAFVVEELEYF